MSLKISEFRIVGLHGNKDLTIPIRDNRIVIVGTNGLGKTTVINLLYLFLTRQWNRLKEYKFEKLSLKISNRRFDVNYDDLTQPFYQLPLFVREEILDRVHIPASVRRRIKMDDSFFMEIMTGNISMLSGKYRISRSMIERIAEYGHMHIGRYWHGESSENNEKIPDNIIKFNSFIEDKFNGEVLYLPTYRRIEQDLQAIFPHMEEEIHDYRDSRFQNKVAQGSGFVELVQFGMQDVDKKIRRILSDLKDSFRIDLNNLTGGYLRDVIRGTADAYDKTAISKLNDEDIKKILDRVEENTLNEKDKKKLRDVIHNIRGSSSDLEVREKYLAHYFSKLVDIYQSQQVKEKNIRMFVDVCNKYLVGKNIEYDDIGFSLHILLDENQDNIEMRSLSSGEKQIVSLFSHVYLSECNEFYVLIDEPELSLSVAWQKNFLSDILNSNKCQFLLAVTHSPFIFDNELDDYAIDLSEC